MGAEFAIKVLGIKEDDGWYAIALSMNLRGYGNNFDGALKDLLQAIDAQLSYAYQHDTLEGIFVPAEKYYLDLYDKIIIEEIRQSQESDKLKSPPNEKNYIAKDIFMPTFHKNNSYETVQV